MRHLAGAGLVLLLLASCGGRPATVLDGAPPRPDTARGRDGVVKDRRSSEAVNGSVFITLIVKDLYADCMPMVPPDPLTLIGHAELLNNGSIAVGPIQFTAGRILRATGEELGAFSVKPIAAYVIKPGEGLSPAIEKVPGSLTPAFDCSSCGKPVRVELAYAGAGLPAGAKIISADVTIGCAY
jgi:hypothetical protein